MITIDDDFIYPSSLIEELVDLNSKFPKAICCHRAFEIKRNGEKIAPYVEWCNMMLNVEPTYDVFFTSGGGDIISCTLFFRRSLEQRFVYGKLQVCG